MKEKIVIKYYGVTKPLSQWCRELGIDYNKAHIRYRRGAPASQVLGFTPYKRRRAKNESLCLLCANARADRCWWVFNGTPIKGWTVRKDQVEGADTYFVINCPRFKEDDR